MHAFDPDALYTPLPLSLEAYLHQLQEEQSTIEFLIEDDGTGTHSILDIRHIGTTPDIGVRSSCHFFRSNCGFSTLPQKHWAHPQPCAMAEYGRCG